MEKDTTHIGPYRATRLWNEVIRTFRNGMPTSRHRRYMKSYEDCFSATEAIDWLHAQIQINPNFGPSVTRAQTLQLLEKFQKARVFEDVRGIKHQEPIGENGRLYRFIHTTPAKTSRTPVRAARTPLAVRSSMVNTEKRELPPTKLDFHKEATTTKAELPSCHLVANSKLTDGEAEDVWKALTLSNLQKLLQLNSLDDILDGDYVDAQNVIHNMTHVNKNGVVCNIKKEGPNKTEDSLPDYPGFERDVFKVVKDYFEGLEEPLLTFSMYEVFTNVFVCAENAGRPRQAPRSSMKSFPDTVPGGITSSASVENLMMDLTMNGMNTDDEEEENPYRTSYLNKAYHPARSCDPRVNGVYPGLRRYNTTKDLHWERNSKYASTRSLLPTGSEVNKATLSRYSSTLSMPLQGDKLETCFGVDDASPCTHLVQDSEAGHQSYGSGLTRQRSSAGLLANNKRFSSTISVETHYGTDESFLQNEHKCLSTNDVHRLGHYPENGLSKQLSSRKSSYSSIPEAVHPEDGNNEIYGYTVVLSTTPKSNQTRERHLSEGNLRHHQEQWNTYIHSDHDYFKRGFSRYQDPPPYVPPPSYKSIYNHPAPSVASSRSSYETAPSHPCTPDRHRDVGGSQNLQYVSQEDLYGSQQEQCKRGKHDSRFSSWPYSGSYRKAVDRDHNYTTPLGRSLFRSHMPQRCQSLPNISSPLSKNKMIECLRICCLLLPPANRRKLHLLLRLMVKMSENEELIIDEDESTRELVLQTFTRCILRSAEEADFDEVLSLRLIWFMVENYADIMAVPAALKTQIEERIAYLRRSKVSVQEFEKQKMTTSQRAINELLDDIVKDKTMAPKEKKRRLKQFQKTHPDIYSERFPNPESEAGVFPLKQKPPRVKPALLSRPLAKLKSFRI